MEMKTFEAEASDGTPVRFTAPANATPDELQKLAADAYSRQKAATQERSAAVAKDLGQAGVDSGKISILQQEYRKAKSSLDAGPPLFEQDPDAWMARKRGDVDSLTKELQAAGGSIPEDIPSAPSAAASAAQVAKNLARSGASQIGGSPEGFAGGAIGGILGALEQRNLPRPVTMAENALAAARTAMMPPTPSAPVSGPSAAPTGPLTGGLTPGEKWGAKTGYGVGPGTVQEASSRYQRSAGQGPVSSELSKTWGVAQPGESPQLSQRLIDRAKAAEMLQGTSRGGLDRITQFFSSMAEGMPRIPRSIGAMARAVPIISYPAAGYSVGEDVGDIQRELANKTPDTTHVALRGAGILGTGMSLFGGTAGVGLPLAVAAPLAAAARRKFQAEANQPPATEEELLQARRPAFRYSRP